MLSSLGLDYLSFAAIRRLVPQLQFGVLAHKGRCLYRLHRPVIHSRRPQLFFQQLAATPDIEGKK